MLSWRFILAGLLICAGIPLVHADNLFERTIQSPSYTVALLELYTSEG